MWRINITWTQRVPIHGFSPFKLTHFCGSFGSVVRVHSKCLVMDATFGTLHLYGHSRLGGCGVCQGVFLAILGRGTSKKIHLISKTLDTLNHTATVYFPNHLIFELYDCF